MEDDDAVPSAREALEAAFDSVDEDEESSDEEFESEDEGSGEEDTVADAEEPSDEDSEDEEDEPEEEESTEDDEDDGDEEPVDTASGDDSGDDGEDEEPEADVKAPASWSPESREKWKDIPAEIKAQVLKREKEVADAIGNSTAARRFAQEWSSMVDPYKGLMAAQGATPYQAVDQLLKIGAGLATGNPTHKADIIKNLINQYQIDLPTLDSMLAGEAPPAGQVDVQGEVQRALQAQREHDRILAERREGETVKSEIETFSKSKEAEFFEDVRGDMADLMDVAAKRGQNLTIQEAYDRACQLHPEVKKVLDQRAAAIAARKKKSISSKKKRAASSIKGTSSGQTSAPDSPMDTRSAIEQAWDKAENRQRTRV
jgi:hypothetical protein